MKALSIKQPWAWLICAGHKDVENRDWHIHMPPLLNYPLVPKHIYVHAGKTIDKKAFEWMASKIPKDILSKFMVNGLPNAGMFKVGGLIGEVHIVGCVEKSQSPWFVGPYGFLLANPVLYDQLIPCKGKLGFFVPQIPEAGG
jgi:hypothetical protein